MFTKQGTRGRFKISTHLSVTSAGTIEIGIVPSKIDSVASCHLIAGVLTFDLGKAHDGIGGLIYGGAGGGEAVEFIGDFVVGGGTDGCGVGAA
jgi:hypothetical protein